MSTKANNVIPPTMLERVPNVHPRLFGSRERLQQMAKDRPDAYKRMAHVAREMGVDEGFRETREFFKLCFPNSKMMSMALTACVENDAVLARKTVDMFIERHMSKPYPYGHVTFGHDVAMGAVVYDLCYDAWTEEERTRFYNWTAIVLDCNRFEEVSPFHNGWYGYKYWGFGLFALATMHEWTRSHEIWRQIETEYRQLAAPAMEFCGAGGTIGEGYYINYWLYFWMVFVESAKLCAGVDLYSSAPAFYKHRAISSMFETHPGFRENGSRRSCCIGDGRGRFYRGERDHELSARRMIAGHYAKDPGNLAAQEFNKRQAKVGADEFSYRDFLWNDPKAPAGGLNEHPLSHCSKGAGSVYARSSWNEDAVWFMFHCGPRFTSHQHQDVGHFFLYNYEELVGEAGHYDSFGGAHDTNFYARTISHNTILVKDPNEFVPQGFRGFIHNENDGGQHHHWVGNTHHNGDAFSVPEWYQKREIFDTGEVLAYHDAGSYCYMAGDATRAYNKNKVELFTRQIVYLRPGTFVIFDRVKSTNPNFKKTWLLNLLETPVQKGNTYVSTHGKGRLFVQPVLPRKASVTLQTGDDLYKVNGKSYPPTATYGIEVKCRMEVSPAEARAFDTFVHVLTTTDSSRESVPQAEATEENGKIVVKVGEARIEFGTELFGGKIEMGGTVGNLRANL